MADRYIFDPFRFEDAEEPSSDDDYADAEDEIESSPEEDSASSSGDSSSEDSPLEPTTSSSSSSSDEDWKPAKRDRVTKPHARTVAKQLGFADADDLRFRTVLARQHVLRIGDAAFCALEETDHPGRLRNVSRWRKFRRECLRSAGILEKLPVMDIPASKVRGAARRSGAPISVYSSIGSVANNIEFLLQLFFATHEYMGATVAAILLCADAIGEAAPGCPAKGKIYSMYMKAMTTFKPQSPIWLIPFLYSLGPDTASCLHRLFRLARVSEIVRDCMRAVFRCRAPPGSTSPITTAVTLAFIGDFPACTSVTDMRPQNRQIPPTAGYTVTWEAPACWLCGIGCPGLYHGQEGHNYRRNDALQAARLRGVLSLIGVPLWSIFYEPVHAVCSVLLALLADTAKYYQKCHATYLHPVAVYINQIFDKSVWDIFLLAASSRSKERRSNKPFFAVDPAVVWSWLLDPSELGPFLLLLLSHDIPWSIDHCPPEITAPSPFLMWTSCILWFNAFAEGNAGGARAFGALTEDLWRFMCSCIAPLPFDRACLSEPRPSFVGMTVGYGPASHVAFCSSWRYIARVDEMIPQWRSSGVPFFKLASGIFLEHGQKRAKADYTDFGIASSPRRFRARELLQRAIERCVLRWVVDDFDPPVKKGEEQNRAYKDVPLSQTVDENIINILKQSAGYHDLMNLSFVLPRE